MLSRIDPAVRAPQALILTPTRELAIQVAEAIESFSAGLSHVHTVQLYFPDSLSDAVYRRSPYSSRPSRTTRNADDMIFRSGGSRSMLKVKRSSSGLYVATITMGIRR